jgi:hypothetical protein
MTLSVARTLRQVHDSHGPFVVKTHREPTPATRELIESGIAQATFAYRDPRDCVLSALDHAERSRRGADPTGAFGNLRSVAESVAFYRDCCLGNYRAWRSYGTVLLIRYEDFMADKPGWLARMAEQFGSAKGTTERWRGEMSAEDQRYCRQSFGPDLAAMGYPVQ